MRLITAQLPSKYFSQKNRIFSSSKLNRTLRISNNTHGERSSRQNLRRSTCSKLHFCQWDLQALLRINVPICKSRLEIRCCLCGGRDQQRYQISLSEIPAYRFYNLGAYKRLTCTCDQLAIRKRNLTVLCVCECGRDAVFLDRIFTLVRWADDSAGFRNMNQTIASVMNKPYKEKAHTVT